MPLPCILPSHRFPPSPGQSTPVRRLQAAARQAAARRRRAAAGRRCAKTCEAEAACIVGAVTFDGLRATWPGVTDPHSVMLTLAFWDTSRSSATRRRALRSTGCPLFSCLLVSALLAGEAIYTDECMAKQALTLLRACKRSCKYPLQPATACWSSPGAAAHIGEGVAVTRSKVQVRREVVGGGSVAEVADCAQELAAAHIRSRLDIDVPWRCGWVERRRAVFASRAGDGHAAQGSTALKRPSRHAGAAADWRLRLPSHKCPHPGVCRRTGWWRRSASGGSPRQGPTQNLQVGRWQQ